MARTATATAYAYVDCPACGRDVMEPFPIAAGPLPFVHSRRDCGARLLVWPDRTLGQHCVWTIPSDVSLESTIVASRAHHERDESPWRWSMLEAREVQRNGARVS